MELKGIFFAQCLLILAFPVLHYACNGFCFVGNLMAEMTVSRRLRYYCEYKGTDGLSMKLFPGSNIYLVDQCLDCKCTMDGLQCCGFGYAGGTIAIKKDCKMLLDGCQALLVKVENQTLDCFTGKPLNFSSLAMRLPHPDNSYESFNSRQQAPPTTTPVPETTTTQVPTTTQAPKPANEHGTLSDYFRYLSLTQGSRTNQAYAPDFLQYTGNTFQSLTPPVQQPPPQTNNWQYDYMLPWFLFV